MTKIRTGFTLIELIIYIAIVSTLLGSLIPFAWNVIGIQAKSATEQEIFAQARYVSERLKYEIRNADDINIGTSDFQQNLATNPVRKLSLQSFVTTENPVLFTVTTTGILQMTRGIQPPVNLNSTATRITNLTFTNYTSANNKTKHIGFTLTMTQPTGQTRFEFQENITIESSVELRSN